MLYLKLDGKSIFWPVNLDSKKTIKEGRRISKTHALEDPKLEELISAAENLKYKFEVFDDAARPNSWWMKTGYIIIEKGNKSKIIVLKEISKKIKSFRA